MSVSVRIPTILRTYTGGAAEVSVDPGDGATLQQVLDALEVAHPGIRARVLDEQGRLRRFVNVYVDDDDVRFADGLATPTPAGAQVSVIPAVAGGAGQGVVRSRRPYRESGSPTGWKYETFSMPYRSRHFPSMLCPPLSSPWAYSPAISGPPLSPPALHVLACVRPCTVVLSS
jgi:molybdopterin synthase sulfur carrier subunit